MRFCVSTPFIAAREITRIYCTEVLHSTRGLIAASSLTFLPPCPLFCRLHDCRNELHESAKSTPFAAYVSMIPVPIAVTEEDSVWELARSVNGGYKEAVELKKHFTDVPVLETLFAMVRVLALELGRCVRKGITEPTVTATLETEQCIQVNSGS